jgi:hypothetical protein
MRGQSYDAAFVPLIEVLALNIKKDAACAFCTERCQVQA